MYRNRVNSNKCRLATCRRHSDEFEVRPGLSMTPSQMADLVADGKPVSTSNLANDYYDGDLHPSWEVPIDLQRGVDLNDVFFASLDSEEKLGSLRKAFRQARVHEQKGGV